jgi:hypothetical protein
LIFRADAERKSNEKPGQHWNRPGQSLSLSIIPLKDFAPLIQTESLGAVNCEASALPSGK